MNSWGVYWPPPFCYSNPRRIAWFRQQQFETPHKSLDYCGVPPRRPISSADLRSGTSRCCILSAKSNTPKWKTKALFWRFPLARSCHPTLGPGPWHYVIAVVPRRIGGLRQSGRRIHPGPSIALMSGGNSPLPDSRAIRHHSASRSFQDPQCSGPAERSTSSSRPNGRAEQQTRFGMRRRRQSEQPGALLVEWKTASG